MLVSVSIADVIVATHSTDHHHRPSSSSSSLSSYFKHYRSSFPSTFKSYGTFHIRKHANTGLNKSKSMGFTVKASDNSTQNSTPIAPLNPESAAGQLLTQILQTRPCLFPAAIDQQLENLQNEREETPTLSQDLPLYRRIAEVKEKERRTALEEIIYCLIVQKFIQKDITLTPKILSGSNASGWIDFWPDQELKLESVHSPESFQMIQSHLSRVLDDRLVGPSQTIIDISKVKLGKLYTALIMYGYFLRRVNHRYQLERAIMQTLPKNLDHNMVKFQNPSPQDPGLLTQIGDGEDGGSSHGKSYELRSYVMHLDAETHKRYATLRSKEAKSLVEKQTQALFGGTQNDEILSLMVTGLTMLVLEAVTFGSFLWDAEDYVESKYSFVDN